MLPCESDCASRWRQAGSAGRKRIASVRFGGTATIAARALHGRGLGVDLDPSSDQRMSRAGASSRTRSPRRSASRIGISCEPPTTRRREALVGLEELVGAAGAGDHPQPLQQREGVGGLGQEAAREPGAQQVLGHLVGDLARSQASKVIESSSRASGCAQGASGSSSLASASSFASASLERPLRRGAQRRVVALVAVGLPGGVDVDVLALAEAREELDPELARAARARRTGTGRPTGRRARSPRRRSRCSRRGRRPGRAPRARRRRRPRGRASMPR